MYNSDNVVRCGLTPKAKDTETLYKMLNYELPDKQPVTGKRIQEGENYEVLEYKSGWDEFRIFKVLLNEGAQNIEL